MNIKILSDSTCDLSAAQLKEHNIDLAHLTIVKDGVAYRKAEHRAQALAPGKEAVAHGLGEAGGDIAFEEGGGEIAFHHFTEFGGHGSSFYSSSSVMSKEAKAPSELILIS